MFFIKKPYINDLEVLANSANLVTISSTINSENVNLNSEGKKYVVSGSLIDLDGNIVTEIKSGSEGSFTYSLSSTPIGILYKTVNVTNGNMSGALIIEGYVREDRVLENFENTKDEIKNALPEIKFM
ncbi:hypothetical protein V3Q09_15890 [Clostridioides difficile]|uniref:hypothetical protein n=1 Tax=Clostridioides difficile TaxID=1496 RepID=UPI001C1BA4FD|nr:hypothetical protein [Clostridioides difficile]MDB0345005.1 hypothetical protein [Clostridioides difficile]MDB0464939.1 hypothetical protein [Clostridioides difficile]HBG4073046.1 hypothetical protein [Clostridioides difficile]HDF2649219.1 hypothetical protein [Clostridioides difficile]